MFKPGDRVYFLSESSDNAEYFRGFLCNLQVADVREGFEFLSIRTTTLDMHYGVHPSEIALMPIHVGGSLQLPSGEYAQITAIREQFTAGTVAQVTVTDHAGPSFSVYVDLPTMEVTLEPPLIVSETQVRVLTFTDYIRSQVRSRYAFLVRPRLGRHNQILDSYAPRLLDLMYSTPLERLRVPSTATAISPFIASNLQVPVVPASDLVRLLGFTKRDLTSLIETVKAKSLDICFIGFGGTGVNTTHWLTEICKITGHDALFNSLTVVEPDSVEFSNLLRFPIDPNSIELHDSLPTSVRKLELFQPEHARHLAVSVDLRSTYLEGPLDIRDCIYYGAPDLGTRQVFCGSRFIAATHSGNSCNLYLNPTQDSDLQVETYGVIDLGVFFLNQLRMAIAFLELLASDTDLSEIDRNLFTYSFSEPSTLRTSKRYCITVHSETERIPYANPS